MSTETVTLGCRLPNGFVLEVGLQTTIPGPNGRPITQVAKGDKYQRCVLLGTNAAYRKTRIRMPSTLTPEPYLNAGVPKDLWEQWKKDHPKSWALKNGHIFEVKNASPAENAAAVLDSMSRPLALAPLDPSGTMKVGADKIEKANFDD